MTRGGSRLNAGRRSTWASGCSHDQTKIIRVPKAIASEILEIAHERDAMPTDKPKVSAYVPQLIKDRLKRFTEENGVSESQAVTVILAEYFGIEQELSDGLNVGGVTLSRMEALEEKLQQLEAKLEAGQPSKKPFDVTDIYDRHYGNGNGKKTKALGGGDRND